MKKKVFAIAAAAVMAVSASATAILFAAAEDPVKSADKFSSDSALSFKTTDEEWLDKNYSGVDVLSDAAGTTTLVNPVYIGKNTANDVLAEFVVLPSVRGKVGDFSSFQIKFTDYKNQDNYFAVRFVAGGVDHWQVENSVYVSGKTAAMSEFAYFSTSSNKMISSSVVGQNVEGGSFSGWRHWNDEATPEQEAKGAKISSVKLYYDSVEKKIYSAARGTKQMIFDLDDEFYTGLNKTWNGFTDDRCIVSFTTANVSAKTTEYVIINVNGQTYENEDFTDVKKPDIKIVDDGYESAPVGIKGKNYRLFSATAFDENDGDTEVKKSVYFGKELVAEGVDEFVPQSAGVYTIKHYAEDKAGNGEEVAYDVTVEEYLPQLSFETEYKPADYVYESGETVAVGSKIYLADAKINGGSGNKTVTVTVTHNETGEEVSAEDGSIFVERAGNYKITYSATDYLGDKIVKTFVIVAVNDDAPIADWPNMPKYMVKGKTYRLNDFKTYDYTDGSGEEAKKSITVADGNGKTEFSSDNAVYTPLETGEVKITYRAVSNADSSRYSEKSYTVKVLEPETLMDYFYNDEGAVTTEYDTENFDTYYYFGEDAEMDFINALPADGFGVNFYAPSDIAAYSAIKYVLTDAADASISIEIKIVNESGAAIVYLNDEKVGELSNGFNDASAPSVGIKLSDNKLLEFGGKTISVIKNTYGKLQFKGFTSGLVYFSVGVEGVYATEGVRAGLMFSSICDQRLPNTKIDRTGPVVILSGSISTYQTVGEWVKLPSARAVDVLDPTATVTVSLVDENGTPAVDSLGRKIEDLDCSEDIYVKIDASGKYTLTYTAKDSSRGSSTETFNIEFRSKVKPVVSVKGIIPETVKAGETLKLPTVTVDEGIALQAYIITPYSGKVTVTSGGSYTFKDKGTYVLYLYAADEFGNYTLRSFAIKAI